MRRLLFVLMLTAASPAIPAFAQAGAAMPDASQMAGLPIGAPELATGTVAVRLVRERMGNNIANHPVTLGSATETWTATTDEQGRAQFTGIPTGTVVRAAATVDGENLVSQDFDIPASSGVRVALVAGATAAAAAAQAAADAAAQEPAREGIVVFGADTRVIFEFQNDELRVFYLLDLINRARTPVDTGGPLILDLPQGAAGASLLQGSSTLATVRGTRLTLTGPFPPGTSSIQVGFGMPYRGERLTVTQAWPAVVEQMLVAAQKVGALHMTSPQFTNHSDVPTEGGFVFVMGQVARLNAGEAITLELEGLPHASLLMRDLFIGLSVLVLAIGAWASVGRARAPDVRQRQLTARREKLFAEMVALEEQHRNGQIDQAAFDGRRAGILVDLERVYGQLERTAGGEGLAA
ncbi:MAG: hypothetical protein Q8L86_02485 [Vicinamibacterales bacterium]|nr:hypothetical protein [Vicinamibacterales bacterium]